LKTASPASWQPNRTRLSRQRPVALEGLLDARRSARETIREICLELRAIVSSLTAANNEAEILDLRATISRQDIVTNLTPKVSASLSLRHFSLRNAKMLTLTMSLKASVETLYLEVWTGRNTLGPKPRGHRIVQPWRPPPSLWIVTLLAKRWWAPSKPISRAMIRLRKGARSVGMACRMVLSRSNDTT
jgi:hypothetical protein